MKKNILNLALISIGLLTLSCSDDFLQKKKLYGVFDEDTFKNETQVGWYIDRLYFDYFSGLRGPGQTLVGKWEDWTDLTEEKGGISTMIDEMKELNTADDCSQYYGEAPSTKLQNNPYTRIRNCNILILSIDEYGTDVSAEYKKTAKGQCYFLRALQYYDLLRVYGGVPISLTVDNASATNPAIKYPRSTTSECVRQILIDLDKAAEMLPDKWLKENQGRITRAAALAMKSRVLLTYASPLYNEEWDDSANERWTQALKVGLEAESELEVAGYGLYGSSAKDWEEMFVKDHGVEFCKEAIFVRMLSPKNVAVQNNGWENSIRLKGQGGSGGVKAPKGMVDLFPMKDGSRPTEENGYDEMKFFMNRDPRFYRTFAFSGAKWGYKNNTNATMWFYRWRYMINDKETYGECDNHGTNAQAMVRKMSDTRVENTFQFSGTDIMEYRFAELILNIAECYAATGELAKCAEYLGKIRARVGILADNNYGLGTFADKYAAIEACLYERQVELAYEGKRGFDVRRWMLYNDDAAMQNNTCEKLNFKPLNGSCRIGKTYEYKSMATAQDPLEELRKEISVDPDATDFEESLQKLADFYDKNLILADPETPLDNDGKGNPAYMKWRQRYYIQGLHRKPLISNSWLPQTIGWLDANSAAGTFDYRD